MSNENSKDKKVANVPNLRFYEDIWNKCFIGDFLKIKSGRDQKPVANANGSYNVYGTGGVIGKATSYIYDSPTVCIGRKGTIDCPFYLEEKFWCVDTLFYSQINSDKVVPKFVYYLFETIDWKKKDQSTGVPSLTSTVIEHTKVFIPSLKNQTKISNFLSILDSRIQTQNKIISELELLRTSIKEMLSHCTSKKIVKIKELLDECSEKSVVQDQYLVLSSTVKGLFLQNEYFDRQISSLNNIGYKVVHRSEIIISPQNLWMGNITINKVFENGLVSPSYKIYKSKGSLCIDSIFNLLTTKKAFYMYKLVSEQGASVVRRNLNIDAFENLAFHIDEKAFEKISRTIESISKKISSEKRILVLLLIEKRYFLNNLFI